MSKVHASLLMILFGALAVVPAAAESRTGELRGAWMDRTPGRDWPAVMKSLKENGFNACFWNVGTGGVGLYPSKVLPAAAGAKAGRDELAEAVKAAKQQGIELHVGRMSWTLEGAPAEVVRQHEADGRLARDPQGALLRDDAAASRSDWLCPSNARNRKLEKDAALELVRRYDVAGIVLDTRLPGPDYCFCENCRTQFQKEAGLTVEHWPTDVVKGGKYADRYTGWRQKLQTSLVKEISTEAHQLKPALFVSAAVWSVVEVARHEALQDWPAWVEGGLLDFLCVAGDTPDRARLAQWLAQDVAIVKGRAPVYAGIGGSVTKDTALLIQQVEASRAAGADGFCVEGSGDLKQRLSALRAGVTAADPNPMPHGGPPTVLALSGPALLAPPGSHRVQTGKKLTIELQLGVEDVSGYDEASAAAGNVLREVREARKPVGSFEPEGGGEASLNSQLSGRAVAETPGGEALATLGVFTGGSVVKSTFTLIAPAGPFRVAIYGTAQDPGAEPRGFVVRSMLFTGVEESAVVPPVVESTHDKLSALMTKFVKQVKPEDVAGLDLTAQISITGGGGGEWWLTARDGKVTSGEGLSQKPDLSLSCSAEDALALSRGEVEPTALLATGRLMVSGDIGLMARLMPLLKRMAGG